MRRRGAHGRRPSRYGRPVAARPPRRACDAQTAAQGRPPLASCGWPPAHHTWSPPSRSRPVLRPHRGTVRFAPPSVFGCSAVGADQGAPDCVRTSPHVPAAAVARGYATRPAAATRGPPGAAGRGGRARGRRPQAPKPTHATVDRPLRVFHHKPRAGIGSRPSTGWGLPRGSNNVWTSGVTVCARRAFTAPTLCALLTRTGPRCVGIRLNTVV